MISPLSPNAAIAPNERQLDTLAVDTALRRMARRPDAPWLHAEVARRMAQRLAIVKLQPQTVLDWWGHTGGGGVLLARAYPQARRNVVEPNEALCQRSRAEAEAPWWSARRWTAAATVVTRAEPEPGAAQLLWANMMLHAVADPPALLARWQRALGVGGFVMFSCFGPDTLRELRALYRALGWPAPGVEFVDMHDLGDMLVAAGFADPVMDQEHLSLTWDSPQALLAELRGLGSNAAPQRFAGLRTARWRQRLERELQALAGADGRLRLSFEVIYGHAFKAAPRPRLASETAVSLEDMRSMVHSPRAPRG